MTEVLVYVSDFFVLVAVIGLVVFVFSYGVLFRWRRTLAGKALMFFVSSLLLTLLLAVVRILFGEVARDFVRPAVFGLIAVAIWALVLSLLRRLGVPQSVIQVHTEYWTETETGTENTMPILKNQFLAGILTLAITVLTAAVAIPEDAWTTPSIVWQFGGMVVSTAAVIFLPLAQGVWAGAIKIGSAIVAAVVANVVAVFVDGGAWGVYQWLLLGLAVLNVVAGELGVQARVTDAKAAIASTSRSDTLVVQAADPKAAVIAESRVYDHSES